MKRGGGIAAITLLALWMIVSPAAAEEAEKEDELTTLKLEEVVVTATRTEKAIESAPGSVSVVTSEEIEDRGVKSVDEALNTLVGAYNPRNIKGGMMDSLSNGGVTLRGIPRANNTLFMLDGMPMNDAYSGSQRSSLAIPAENVERIEVVRGPFSSLYGGNAMGGAVNVITKMPEKRQFILKSGYGSSWDRGEAADDVVTAYLSAGDKLFDRLSLFASYSYQSTNGYPTDLNLQSTEPVGYWGYSPTQSPQGSNRYLIGDRGDKTWWDDNLTFKAGYDFSDTTHLKFLFTHYQYEYDYGDPHTYLRDAEGNPIWSYGIVPEASYLTLSGKSRHENYLYNMSFDTEISPVKVKTSLGFIDSPGYFYITPDALTSTREGGPGAITETPGESYFGDIQFTFPVWERNVITAGGSFKQAWAHTMKHNLTDWDDEDSETDLTFEAGGKERTYAVFLEDEISLLDNLTAYLGFRYDWWETYGGKTDFPGVVGYPLEYDSRSASSFSPKAALVYKPFEETTLRTSVGQAFRPPTVYELYSVWLYRGMTTLSGPDLEPETATCWDIGIEQGLWKGAKARVTYFENYLEDLIYSQTISSTVTQKVNIGSAESRGIELEIEQHFDKWLRLFSNFTLTNAYVTENSAKPETEGKKLVQVPEFMFNVGGDFTYGPVSTSLTGRYVSKRYNNDENTDEWSNVYTSYDPYFVADARIAYKITDFASVSFSVDNILDRDYFSYYKAPGRSYFGEVTFKF